MSDAPDRSGLFGHPRGLSTLFFTELWERFSYYGMRAILMLFMVAPLASGGLALDTAKAAGIYGLYTGCVYFTAIPGGLDRGPAARPARRGARGRRAHRPRPLLPFGAASPPLFYAGLVLIVLGTGLLKPNISSIVGQLYPQGDPRRDAGFSIFYMGINLGALVSPLICGWLAQKVGWHWGFGAAAIGMTLGVVQFVLGRRRLGDAGLLRERPQGRLHPLGGWPSSRPRWRLPVLTIWSWRDFAILGGTVLLFAWLLKTGGRSPEETQAHRRHHGPVRLRHPVLGGLRAGGVQPQPVRGPVTPHVVFGWSFPSSWYQSVQPLFIIMLAPVFAWLWVHMGSRSPRARPSSPGACSSWARLLSSCPAASGSWPRARRSARCGWSASTSATRGGAGP